MHFHSSNVQYYHQEMLVAASNSKPLLQYFGNFQQVQRSILLHSNLKQNLSLILHESAGIEASLIEALTCPLKHNKYSNSTLSKEIHFLTLFSIKFL